jgi:hypothetical protein
MTVQDFAAGKDVVPGMNAIAFTRNRVTAQAPR